MGKRKGLGVNWEYLNRYFVSTMVVFQLKVVRYLPAIPYIFYWPVARDYYYNKN